jgi:putative ABC transport system ATP-binding protein
MSLLELEDVSKRRRDAQRERIVLEQVSMEVEAGELVGVWGPRRSGRTTLLRVAAGLEAPDVGTVRFQGRDLADSREQTLGAGIGYVSKTLRANEEQGVLEQVSVPLLARGVAVDIARERARAALARAGASGCAAMRVSELAGAEALRVAVARTLVLAPAMLVIDEPCATAEVVERDGIIALLRELAAQGTAVLTSSSAPEELGGFHRVLALGEGRLRGPAGVRLAPVVALRARSL